MAEAPKPSAIDRLRSLNLRRNEARKMNHQELVEEERKKKLPANWESKKKLVEYEEEQERLKKECAEKGEDYEIVRLRDYGAEESERWDNKRKKKNPDIGFSDFEQATFRQYQRLTKTVKPDMAGYEREKAKMGETFYPTVDTLGVETHKDTPEAVNKLAQDVEKQIQKRAKYSRRRAHDEDDDIDYINERNMKFNKKLERFYGKHTATIKQNLERGTAI